MNVFLHELRTYRKSTIIWAVSLSVLAVVFLMMFPSFTKDVAASKKILSNLPPALRDSLGISLNNFFTVSGFYAYLLTFAVLAAAIQAMNMGVGVISKEESGKTADFLLTKPLNRSVIITSKLLAVLLMVVITNIVFVSVSFITAKIVSTEPFDYKSFLLISASVFLIQITFLAIGALFSVIIPKIKSVIAVSIPTVFSFFIVGTIGAILGNENVRYISPFKFFDSNYIINHGAYEMRYLIIETIIIVVAITTTYYIFVRKDIRPAA